MCIYLVCVKMIFHTSTDYLINAYWELGEGNKYEVIYLHTINKCILPRLMSEN